MTGKRFKVARYLVNHKPWELFWVGEKGTDRIHHGFWSCMDKTHHRYEPDNAFENAIFDYYKYTDEKIGELLACFDLDKTAVWIVSDHGAKSMVGGFMFNQWLMNEGLLHFKEPVGKKQKFDQAAVDWSKPKVWGEGG